jgi:hypothetical protein
MFILAVAAQKFRVSFNYGKSWGLMGFNGISWHFVVINGI